jgi:beta-fructofuranosidase
VNQTPKLNHQYQLDIYYDYHIFEIFINDGYYVLSQIVYQILEDQTHYNKEVTTILQIR